MYLHQYLFICFFLVGLPGSGASLPTKNNPDERRVKVAIRMVGHEILLRAGDSLSRVLPIERERDVYILPCNTDFQFDPDELVSLIDSIFTLSGLTYQYLVEVKECDTKKVVYSFEIRHESEEDLVPCTNRVQPKACYILYFSFFEMKNPGFLYLDSFVQTEFDKSNAEPNQKLSGYYLIALLFLFVGGIVFYNRKSKMNSGHQNTIRIGKFQYDKINMTLIYQNEIIELSSREAELLLLLHQSANHIIKRDVLLNKVWGDDGDYVGRTLDVFISKLRKKLEAGVDVKIVNIRGVGYKLIVQEE